MGPFTNWPTREAIGFDYFYGFLGGETSQGEPRLLENLHPVEPPHQDETVLTEICGFDMQLPSMLDNAGQRGHNAPRHPLSETRRLNLREIVLQPVTAPDAGRFQALMGAHRYLGALPKIGHTLW
jgi:hypothetical protein